MNTSLIMEKIQGQIVGQSNPYASRENAKYLLTDSPTRNTIKSAIISLLPVGDISTWKSNGTLDRAVNNVIHDMKEKHSINIIGGKKSRKSRKHRKSRKSRKHRKSKKYRKSRKYSKKR
jgi:hypothetical protein